VTPNMVTYITQHEWRHDPCENFTSFTIVQYQYNMMQDMIFLEKNDVNYLMLESKVQHTHTFHHRVNGYYVMSLVPWCVHIDEFEHNFLYCFSM
jgi:hypothetical protein